MPVFNDYSNEIIKFLNCLTYDQLRVLFGNSKQFKNWLKNKEIEDTVSIN